MRPARIEGTWAFVGLGAGQGTGVRSRGAGAGRRRRRRVHQPDHLHLRAHRPAGDARRARHRSTPASSGADARPWAAPSDSALREVMFVERDWSKIEGRWFTGGYDELGVDVKLTRVGRDLTMVGLDHSALRTGGDRPDAEDLRRQPAGGAAGRATSISAPASPPPRPPWPATSSPRPSTWRRTRPSARARWCVGAVTLPAAVTVYDKVDAIRVTPGLEHGPHRRRGVPEAVRRLRRLGVTQRRRQEAEHRRRPQARRGRPPLGASRNTRPPSTTRTSSSSAASTPGIGPVHAQRRRAEPAAQGRAQQHRRRLGGGDLHAARRSAPLKAGRTCWSRRRSTSSSIPR